MDTQHIKVTHSRPREAINPQEAHGSIRAGLPQLNEFLGGAGIAFLEQNYDGRDGTGMFTTTRFVGADGQARECDPPKELREALCRVLLALIDRRFPRWRLGHGAFGQFVWELVSDTLEHRHSERHIDYDTSFWYGL